MQVMSEKDLLNKCDLLVTEIVSLLEQELVWFSKKFGNFQRRSDWERGLINKGGILVQKEAIEYRILFEGYEFSNLKNFLTLYKEMYANKDNIFTEFSLRTLIEIGFYRTQILYSDQVSKKKREGYKCLLLLADYYSVGLNNQKRAAEFKKLYKDNKELLSGKETTILDEMEKILDKQDSEQHSGFIGQSYFLISNREKSLFKKTDTIGVFEDKKIKGIYSSFSRILHGNFLLLEDLFSERRKSKGHFLRVYWFLLMTGVNVTHHAGFYTKEDTFISNSNRLIDEYKQLAQVVSVMWRDFE